MDPAARARISQVMVDHLDPPDTDPASRSKRVEQATAEIEAVVDEAGLYHPLGIVEIAELFDLSREAVNSWRRPERDLKFPEPRGVVGGRPSWDRAEVEAWGRRTGRLPAT